jgi:alcohol dehydrogenase class IV
MHLPLELTRATGLDAFSHAIGSYVSTTSNAYADALTVEAMELIETHLRDATFHGADAPLAREQMSLAAMLAMLGRVNGGKAAIHSFAYGLQEMYDLPHGEAIAMVLPEVVEYNLPAAVEQLARLGTRIYDADGTDRERAQAVVDGLYRLRSDVGLDRSLGSVGSRDDLNRLAEYALHSERHLRENPRDVTERDARTLLERLF